ncbi:MAG: hypothetical protein LBG59_04930 [Candidatus Peribacteria bacterium]|jgi:hypothetical protein|nr:hypothetical protein [Candidatus Peribacteria bacterium]
MNRKKMFYYIIHHNMSEKKHLTQSQFKKIAILLDIGEHVINSIRKTTDEDYDPGFNTIVEDAVKYAEKCGFKDLYTRD